MVKIKRKQAPAPDNSRVMLDTVLTPEARRHGAYVVAPITVTDGEFDGQTKGEMSVVRNFDVDAIERWGKGGQLDARQLAAVAIYRRAHSIVHGSKAVTLNWERFLAGVSGRAAAMFADTSTEAEDDLKRAHKALGPPLVSPWKSIVIHNEALGPAGQFLKARDQMAARTGSLKLVRVCCDAIAMEWRL
jgi:hypothetical protein